MIYKKSLTLYFALFVLAVSVLGGCSNAVTSEIPKAEKGVLDLTQWDTEERVIRLDGEWEFYWEQLLSPQDFKRTMPKSEYMTLPISWNHYSGNGYATYRLVISLRENCKLALKIPRIFTAYDLWVNEEFIASAGTVGETRETMTPQYLPQLAFFEAQEGENEIIIQVSNFYHRSGGVLESIKLGAEKEMLGNQYKSLAFEFILFGSLMIIGTYHLALFLFRKRDLSSLFFGLFCIFVGIRTLLVGERFLIYLFPDFNWEIAHKIQTLIFYLGVPLILMFFESVFHSYFSKRVVRISQSFGIIFGCMVLFTPARIFTLFNPVYQIFSILIIIYIVMTFVKLLCKKEKGVLLIFIGGISLILTSLNDIVFLSVWMNDDSSSFLRGIFRTGNLSSVGQLIFVFTNSLVLAKKFTMALEKEEVMSKQLKEVNLHLDQLVLERTGELEKSKKEIENQKLELEKANTALQLISLKDPLTGLWNRRKYDETIELEWRRCLRHKRPLSLMIIDIDNFKTYNDTYGHNKGDDCLVKIARAIGSCFNRAEDLVARYGGEEFVAIMPELAEDHAMRMAELVRNSIEGLKIPHRSLSVGDHVTVSIGVTSGIPEQEKAPIDFFTIADKALYEAKAFGKNQTKFRKS